MKQVNKQVDASAAESALPKRGVLRIRMQLLLGFLTFTAVILAVIWVMQIVLLNPIYESTKADEVKAAAKKIRDTVANFTSSPVLNDMDAATKTIELDRLIDKTISDIVQTSDISILVADERGVALTGYTQRTRQLPTIWQLTYLDRIELFIHTKENGGEVIDAYHETNSSTGVSERKSMVLSLIVPYDNEVGRLVILETEIVPVSATVQTLKLQLVWITAVMLILCVVLALLIATRISKPIISINQTAKQLASGDTNVIFEEKGSVETIELARTLNFAATELSKTESMRRELLANVSHDLRTPLTMIKGYGEVMRDIPGENTPENVQIIIDESARLADLVNDLLVLSKLESGNTPLSRSRFSLTQAVRDILNRYDKLADFQFIFSASDEVFVYADELKISQVLYNLINNAIHYAGQDKEIRVVQTVQNQNVRIEVIDKGDGIPADKLQDIWERYYKIDKTHKRAQKGTGLGLSIVKNILNLHNSPFGVSSAIGQGSVFWFELPVDSFGDQ